MKGCVYVMKLIDIVRLIAAGTLTIAESSASPAAVARPIRSDLTRYRAMLNELARGQTEDGYEIRVACAKCLASGACPGCSEYRCLPVWGENVSGICQGMSRLDEGVQGTLNLTL